MNTIPHAGTNPLAPAADRFAPRMEILALFAALSLFFATIEYLIPKPLPYMRLGLANIPLLLALRVFDRKSYWKLVFLKVLAQALLHGTLASYVLLFSLSGSITSAAVMQILDKFFGRSLSLVGIGLGGALASSIAQGSIALLFIFGPSAIVLLPLLLLSSLVAGTAVGLFSEYYLRHSRFMARLLRERNQLGKRAGEEA